MALPDGPGKARRRGRAVLTLTDRYLMALLLPRMALALGVTLAALMLERLLRLAELIVGQGAGVGPVLGLMLTLVPHYVQLALPAAFALAILSVMARLGRGSEIDAMRAAGLSIARIGRVFVLASLPLAAISLALFGFLQPLSRYAFQELRHDIAAAGWDGRVAPGVVLELAPGLTLTAEAIDPTGRELTGILLIQGEGLDETLITAPRGLVRPDPATRSVGLLLVDGHALRRDGSEIRFERLALAERFAADANPFRPRGESERELTIPELLTRIAAADGLPPEPRYASELADRLIRAVSILGVALLAVPLGVGAKRGLVWPRAAAAIAALAVYDHLIKALAALADQGRVGPEALWALAAGFLAATLALYLGAGRMRPPRAIAAAAVAAAPAVLPAGAPR